MRGLCFVALAAMAGVAHAACGSAYAPAPEEDANEGGVAAEAGSGGDATAPGIPDAAGLPECPAQRLVNISAGQGGFAWFTLLWPVPAIITNPSALYAIDDVTRYAPVASAPAVHPLFARRTFASQALWEGSGRAPQPSAILSGSNATHSSNRIEMFVGPLDIAAAAASAQSGLGSEIPALVWGVNTRFVVPAGGTAPLKANTVDDAIAGIRALTSRVPESDLRLDTAKVAAWAGMGARPALVQLAERLVFTANVLRLGLVSTVVMTAVEDDPHQAFSTDGGAPIAGPTADAITRILDNFYADLKTTNERSCGRRGAPLSLADNVAMVIGGDTPKNAFEKRNWPDFSQGNSNWLYVRSNGFLQDGWFGSITPGAKVDWDPATGAPSPTAVDRTAAQRSALAGVLYAVSRGNKTLVDKLLPSTVYTGLLGPNP